MDARIEHPTRTRLVAALVAALPPQSLRHPDVQWLLGPMPAAPAGESALATLAALLPLSALEHAAALLALWVELDARMAATLALLQGHDHRAGGPRPTLGLLAALAPELDDETDAASAIGRLLQGRACASGLLVAGEPGAPAHARPLALAAPLLPLLTRPAARLGVPLRLGGWRLSEPDPITWPLPARWRAAAAPAPEALLVVLRGGDRAEALAVAAWRAAQSQRRAVVLEQIDPDADGAGVVPALHLLRAWPVWIAPVAPGQSVLPPAWPLWNGPRIVWAGREGAVDAGDVLPLEIDLAPPDAEERAALWRALRGGDAVPEAVTVSRCGASVLAAAAAAPEPDAARALQQAVRQSARALSAWAQLSTDRLPEDAWVGPPAVQQALDLLLVRCRLREQAAAGLGPLLDGRLNAGVKALFIGVSGTGKTLAAQWIADRLARPLLKADLASLVSKYIGETEKNLALLLAAAEQVDAVLLFDEADSLFGARTDVRQANDRYANMQTNYLLQRLESFRGVALMTSNSKARFDEAFLRRLDAVLEFPLPAARERRRLWDLHLGAAEAIDDGRRDRIAALADLPGGHIRNAALTAGLLARARGAAAPEPADLLAALALEYAKLGQRLPDRLG